MQNQIYDAMIALENQIKSSLIACVCVVGLCFVVFSDRDYHIELATSDQINLKAGEFGQ
jgi:hypothetical protein